MSSLYLRLIPLVLFMTLGVFFLKGLTLNPQHIPSVKIGKPIPLIRLPALDGNQPFFSGDLKGRVVLLNVWASWCPTCQEEQSFLLMLAQQGVVIYGLNYKDDTEQARRWLRQWGNPYILIGVDKQGKAGIDLGVYGAPETFLVDAEGLVQYRYAGALNARVWQDVFLPKIRELKT